MEQQKGTELMPLIQKGDDFLVDGRILHKALKVGKNFRHWIMNRISEYNFEEGKDYFRMGVTPGSKTVQVSIETETDIKNGMKIEYSLTLDMAKELAMIERNEIGRMFRRYFILKEKEARNSGLSIQSPANLFNTLPHEMINGHKLYAVAPLMKQLGYKIDGYSYNSRRTNYPNHFLNIGSRVYVTEAYAAHLFKSSLVLKSRRDVKKMQPILGADFASPLQIK